MFTRNPQPGEGSSGEIRQQQASIPVDPAAPKRRLDLASDFVPVGADFSLAPDPEDFGR